MRKKIQISAVLVLVLAILFCAAAQAESYEAGTMRLLRHEGTVEIFDPSGESRFVMDNVRFASGEAMRTGAGSTASVSLDDTKIVTLDADTKVEFIQEGDHFRLNLIEGALFLDVSEKLDENESLYIQTSTMTVGIRGTIVYLSQEMGDASNGIGEATKLAVLEGRVEFDYEDMTGSRRRLAADAGQKVTIKKEEKSGIGSGSASGSDAILSATGVAPVITTLTNEDIAGFVVDEILADEALTRRVIEGSENGAELLVPSTGTGPDEEDTFDFPAEGEWTWEETVTLVAQSASKLYDGQPLTRHSDVLVYGLPQGVNIQVSAKGSRTNAGESANPIGDYRIFNNSGEEITDHFKKIETVSGTLKIDPAPLTVVTGSAEKYYDGEELTNPEAELLTVPNRSYSEPAWRNTSIVTRSALGSESMIAVSGSTWVHGTNPLTGETQALVLYTGQQLSVCLSNEDDADSIEFRIETLKEEELPEDVLRLYADNPALLAQACEDTGWDPELLAELINQLPKATEGKTSKNGLRVARSVSEDVMRDSSDVRITIDSDITNYNSRPLTGEEAHFTPIVIDPSIVITATGSQTEVGESANTYTIDWGTADKNNYILTEELGTLTVLPLREDEIVIRTGSLEKVYDGIPLTSEEIEVSGIPEGEGWTVEVTAEGSITDAGTVKNTAAEYRILDAEGNDITNQFANITVEAGTLEVKPAPLTVTTGSAEKVYDGEELVCGEATLAGLVKGEKAKASATGSITAAGSADNTYEIQWGSAKKENYEITEELGTLTVEALTIDVDLGGGTASYTGSMYIPEPVLTYTNGIHAGETVSGTRLRSADVLYRFTLFTGDSVDVTISGMGMGAGTYTLSADVSSESENVNASCSITTSGLEVTIEPCVITVYTGSASKIYDGLPLMCEDGAYIEGIPNDEDITVLATGEITEVGSAENTYEIDWGDAEESNYAVTEALGTLEITSYDTPIVFTAGSAEKYYDGTELTAPEVEVSGMPEGFEYAAEGTGSQTEIGSGTNGVTYTIWNAQGEDVTETLPNVSVVEGTLTVIGFEDEVTITTASATKIYDGEPLTAEGVTVEGLPEGFTCTAKATGSQTNAGESYNTLSEYAILDAQGNDATLAFTNITEEIGTLKVERYTFIVKTGGTFAYDGTYHYAQVMPRESVSSDAFDFGTVIQNDDGSGKIVMDWGDEITFQVTYGGKDVGKYGANALVYSNTDNVGISGLLYDLVEITKNDMKIVIHGYKYEKTYDGTPLEADVYTFDLPDACAYSCSTTVASRTEAGTSTFMPCDWIISCGGVDVTENFTNVTAEAGSLTVKPLALSIDLGDETVDYDGNWHAGSPEITCSNSGYTLTQIANSTFQIDWDWGDEVTFNVSGTGRTAGNYTLTCSRLGGTAASNYSATFTSGTLKIEKVKISANLHGDTLNRVFGNRGSIIIPDLTYTSGGHKGESITRTNGSGVIGNATSYYTLFDGTRLTVTVTGGNDNSAGKHSLTASGTQSGSYDVDNFEVKFTNDTYTVTPAPITVRTGSAKMYWTGEPLTWDDAEITGLVGDPDVMYSESDYPVITATGSQTEIGSSDNTYSISWNGFNKNNYKITEDIGTLTVLEPEPWSTDDPDPYVIDYGG